MSRVTVTVRDSTGATATAFADYTVSSLYGGYYLSGAANFTADTAGMNLRSFTQYRTLADVNGLPGYAPNYGYLNQVISSGVMGLFVIENKTYTGSNPQPAQSFTVEGRSYSVPAANAAYAFAGPQTCYGYTQITSGQCDGLLHRFLASTRVMPTSPWVWQLGSEMDTYHQLGMTENGVTYTWAQADARGVAAMQYIAQWLRNPPAGITPIGSHIKFVLGVGGWDQACWLRLHPESLMPYVDAVGFNVYRLSAAQTAQERFARTYNWRNAGAGPLCKAKDVWVTEWGAKSTAGDQATWIATVPAAINAINASRPAGCGPFRGPVNYFNSGDGALSPKANGLAALRSIYAVSPFA